MNLQHSGWSGDATFMDINDDGFSDLYVLNMQGDDRFYENEQGKRFVEKTAAYFPKTRGARWASNLSITTRMDEWTCSLPTCIRT